MHRESHKERKRVACGELVSVMTSQLHANINGYNKFCFEVEGVSLTFPLLEVYAKGCRHCHGLFLPAALWLMEKHG